MPYIEFGKFNNVAPRPVWTDLGQGRGGYIHAQEIVLAGGTKGIIRSQNYVSATSGWAIFGDGSAEFNNVTVYGDIISSVWDGANPANLATRDGTATAGFYLDSSAGAAQFEGNVWLGGDLDMDSGGRILQVNASGELSMIYTAGGWYANWVEGTGDFDTYLDWNTWDYAAAGGGDVNVYLRIQPPTDIAGSDMGEFWFMGNNGTAAEPPALMYNKGTASVAFALGADPDNIDMYIASSGKFHLPLGAVGTPSYSFNGDVDTGMYSPGGDQLSLAAGGVEFIGLVESTTDQLRMLGGTSVASPPWANISDPNTGFTFPAADQISIVAGGVEMMRFVESTTDYIEFHESLLAEAEVQEIRWPDLGGATNSDIGFIMNQGLGLEMGRSDGTSATPFIDMHTGDDVDYNIRLLANGNNTSGLAGARLDIYSSGIKLASGDGQEIFWGADSNTYINGDTADLIEIFSGGNQVATFDSGDRITVVNEIYGTAAMGTTASHNTLRWHGTTYQFLRFTSSKRFKKNIRKLGSRPDDLDPDIILGLRPVIFDDRIDRNAAPDKQVPGFIAEEVFELDQRLATFDRNGEIEAYDESKMNVLLIAQVQKLAERITQLEAQLA